MNRSRVEEAVRRYYAAFHAKDRAAAEAFLSDDFTFTSPVDDHLDKAQFFERCWPNSERLRNFRLEKIFDRGDEAFVRYRCERASDGIGFRNTEYLRLEGDKLKEVQVYFGSEDGSGEVAEP